MIAGDTLATYFCRRHDADIVGCWPDSTGGKYAFYCVYVDGVCLNEGDPYYTWPTFLEVEALLETL